LKLFLERSPKEMKKFVIATGGKQYLVSEGDTIEVESLATTNKTVQLETLLVIDGDKVSVGKPGLKDFKLTAEVIEAEIRADKVTSIRYKSKKRVHTVHGHRQHLTKIKINKTN